MAWERVNPAGRWPTLMVRNVELWRAAEGSILRYLRNHVGYGYSITLSAATCSVSGTVRPSALAVSMLMTSSNFVGWSGAGCEDLRSVAQSSEQLVACPKYPPPGSCGTPVPHRCGCSWPCEPRAKGRATATGPADEPDRTSHHLRCHWSSDRDLVPPRRRAPPCAGHAVRDASVMSRASSTAGAQAESLCRQASFSGLLSSQDNQCSTKILA